MFKRKDTEVTKLENILNKLKTGFIPLFIVCFASFITLSEAYAATPAIKAVPSGNSSVFKTQPNAEYGSVAMNKEVRRFKRAVNKTVETGAGIHILKYGKSLAGDLLTEAFDSVEKGFDAYENALGDGLIKDILVTYNPGYQIFKFASKTYAKIGKIATRVFLGVSNRDCNIERMNSIYKSGCYSCFVVKSLISAFINACSKVYDITREAGHKILIIGLMLWVAFFVLQQISSLKNIEPAAMVNDMLIMGFKVLGAYVVIGAGIDFFISYAIVPVMTWGTDFGTALLVGTSTATGLDITGMELDTSYLVDMEESGGVLPTAFLNNIIQYVAAVDYAVSTHLQVGHMITCHATHAGAWDIVIAVIPNIWIWVCGAALWFAGFIMTLSIAFYLVDISFKLGFAIIALPIMVALWPFNITKDKLAACFSIILKSAGIFIFLAMTTAAGLALISNAFDVGSKADSLREEAAAEQGLQFEEMAGTQKLMMAVEDSDSEYISNTFSLFGPTFIIILFAYLYAIKLIGSTIKDYVNTFFPDSVIGDASPMHNKLTQAMAYTKSKLSKPIKKAAKIAKHQSKNMLKRGMGKSGGSSKGGLFKKFKGGVDDVNKLTDGNLGEKEKQKKQSKVDSAMEQTKLKGGDQETLKDADKEAAKGGKEGGNAAEQAEKAIKSSGDATAKAMEQGSQTAKAAGEKCAGASKDCLAWGPKNAANTYGLSLIAGAIGAAIAGASAIACYASALALKISAVVVKKTAAAMAKVAATTIKMSQKMVQTTKKVAKKTQQVAKKIQQKVKQQKGKKKKKPENKDDDDSEEDESDGNRGSGDDNESDGNGDSDDLMETMTRNPKKK